MQVRMSDEETKLVYELVQDALFDGVQKSQELGEETSSIGTPKMRDVLLERLEKKLR